MWILNRNLIKAMIIITSVIIGAGASILWVAEGKYFSNCASDENKGFFTSFFWSFNMASTVIGNIIAGLVLKHKAKESSLFIAFGVCSTIGSLLLLFLKKPIDVSGKSTVRESSKEGKTDIGHSVVTNSVKK